MFKLIKHLFVPHIGNNHRSKIIHNSSLLVLIVMLLFSSWFTVLVSKTNPDILGISYSISDQELLILVNERRLEEGLHPLKLNPKLSTAATGKANHMIANNYWAHFAPDNTSPWKFITESGYDYMYAGENLAKGFVNADDAVDAWMNSPSHRDNILSSQYDDIGFAIIEGRLQGEDTVLIVELFGKEKNQFLATNQPDIESALGTIDESATGSAEVSVNETVEVPLLGTNEIDGLENITGLQSTISQSSPMLDILLSAKTIAFLLTAVLLVAFIIDLAVVMKRKIPRLVGDNLDHILLLSIFIVFIFMYNLGTIL